MQQRPRAVPIVAAFLFAATAIAVLVGISLLFPNRLTDRLWEFNQPGAALFRAIGRTSGVFVLALGVATAAAARGLLLGKPWAWWFAAVLFTIEIGGNIVNFFVTGEGLKSIIGVAVSSAFLYFLCQRNVRRYFQR